MRKITSGSPSRVCCGLAGIALVEGGCDVEISFLWSLVPERGDGFLPRLNTAIRLGADTQLANWFWCLLLSYPSHCHLLRHKWPGKWFSISTILRTDSDAPCSLLRTILVGGVTQLSRPTMPPRAWSSLRTWQHTVLLYEKVHEACLCKTELTWV